MTTVEVDSQNNNLKLCECGQCNELISVIDKKGRPRRFKKGHFNKCKPGLVGDKNPAWKGGRKDDGHGYWLIWKPDHPFCDSNGYVLEHRLVMEKKLGCYLTREEVVHHIDGNKKNNVISNLMLFPNHVEYNKFDMIKNMSNRV